MRKIKDVLRLKFDQGLSDRQIFDDLIKDHGQAILHPHLLP